MRESRNREIDECERFIKQLRDVCIKKSSKILSQDAIKDGCFNMLRSYAIMT